MLEVLEVLGKFDLLRSLNTITTDGAAPELNMQDLLMKHFAASPIIIRSPKPHLFSDIIIRVAIIGGTITFFLVDEKHTVKNCRNALDTGAKALTMGNYFFGFFLTDELWRIEGVPLLNRDVDRRDRQDDSGLSRLLSTKFLTFIKKHTTNSGYFAYIYIFTQLHSAVQNRSLTNTERLRMLSSVLFFMEGWRKFIIKHPNYEINHHFVSTEFYNIVVRLITGCIGLILHYKDNYPSEPLALWRHMTETVEHLFGTTRSQIKEFDLLEFLQLSSKTVAILNNQLITPDLSHQEARAAEGYSHSYNNVAGISIPALSTYPTVLGVQVALLEGANEAEDLLNGLGMLELIKQNVGAFEPESEEEDILVEFDEFSFSDPNKFLSLMNKIRNENNITKALLDATCAAAAGLATINLENEALL